MPPEKKVGGAESRAWSACPVQNSVPDNGRVLTTPLAEVEGPVARAHGPRAQGTASQARDESRQGLGPASKVRDGAEGLGSSQGGARQHLMKKRKTKQEMIGLQKQHMRINKTV